MSADAARPRHVVIETRDPGRAEAQAAALEAAGFSTTRCSGPGHQTRDCPVWWGQNCDLLDRADVVLHDLDPRDPVDHDVFEGIRSRYARLPVVVEASTTTARRLRHDLDGCTVVVPYSMEHLVDAVAAALVEDVPA
jgi:hypothetical protein